MKKAFSECIIMWDCGNRIEWDLDLTINILECLIKQKQHFDFLLHQSLMTEESFRERLDWLLKTVPSPQAGVDSELVVNGRLGV
jgi:hypothetical protein